ncbi:hypothetical protein FRC19_000288 [Serendipita sp. 401]|nr:hypothetical protein FRC19_000288 [Serendipita sp. 401]KAG8837827.1 hypothetical protein FRC20_006597 [Serendipita sp. 405]KAG9057978.1 hypothetical protein FS842_002313 [Serendipita sp. 407]
MSISYSAGGAHNGTFLNPLPTVDRNRHSPGTTAGDEGLKSVTPEENSRHMILNFDGIEMEGYESVTVSTKFNLDVIYQTVANRRLAFDNMTWQVPIMALSAHAFLFTISLASDTSRTARIMSMGLSFLITLLTARLFIGHMKREVSDRAWLAAFEKQYLPPLCQTHIKDWKFRTNVRPKKAGWMYPLFVFPAFGVWRDGLMIIGGCALAVIGMTIWKPELLEKSS